MKLSQFKFKLPEEQIAQYPAKNRDESRLMVIDRKTGKIEHRIFKEIIEYFDEKDVFVFNDTKVFPARLYGNKEKTGAKIEVFLLREASVVTCHDDLKTIAHFYITPFKLVLVLGTLFLLYIYGTPL
jgi:S-adenosylmethionine:tRNA-ribosyltransferase-isomerase (queuine synthetase)